MTAPTMVFNIHHNFETGDTRTTHVDDPVTFDGYAVAKPHRNARPEASYHAWRWSRQKVVGDASELEFNLVSGELRVFTKIRDIDGMALKDVILGPSTVNGQEDLKVVGLDRAFDTPKPLSVLQLLMSTATEGDDIVLDFFAGSGTSGQAVMAQNALDGGSRRCILVQLPEPLDPENDDQRIGANYCDTIRKPRSIAELTKERLRRAGAKIRDENPMFAGDTGFRVFKLDSTNIQAWQPDSDDLAGTLEGAVEHLKGDRTEQDILYELLLKLGLDLCVPIESREIAGREVYAVGGGALLVCLAPSIRRADVEELANGIAAWFKELAPAADASCVFRDSAFEDDVAKTNMAAIFAQRGLTPVRSL